MQYVKFTMFIPFYNCDKEEYIAFKNPCSDELLQEWADDMARFHGEDYEYLATGHYEYGTEEYEEACNDYWADVCGTFEIVSKEEWEENEGRTEE